MTATDRQKGDLEGLRRGADLSHRVVPEPGFAWKTRVLVPGTILVALMALIGYTAQDSLRPAREVKVVPVIVKAGMEAGAGSTVQAPGWIEADPYPIAVSALADGVVKEVLALEGQTVKAGEVIVRMVSDDARLALDRAEADLAEKQARLEAAQRTWDNPTERVRAVAAAEAMVSEVKAELVKLNADIAAETARSISLKLEADRTAEAIKSRAASEIETARAQQDYQAQLAIVDSTKAREAILQSLLAQRAAELKAAQENLRLRIEETRALAEAKAQLALAAAMRNEAALRLSRMEVRTPVDGVVMQRLAVPGAKLVMNMDDIHSAHAVLLYDPRRLQVRVDIPLADAAKVGVGQMAQIVVAVAPDHTFKGVVSRIVNEADIQKNTLQVKVAISDPSSDLKPEMLARVRFAVGAPTTRSSGQTVFAPMDLIQRSGDGAGAWVVDPHTSVATHRVIQLGNMEHDGWIAVISGLSPGDQLIDESDLREGQRIRVTGEAAVAGHAMAKGGAHASH